MNHSALNVFQDKRLVGELRVDGDCWQFAYDDVWLRAEIYAPGLSPHLAKRKQPFVDTGASKPVQDFFENMLPDGSMRSLVAEVSGQRDSLGLLTRMGHDLPGSLSLQSQDRHPAQPQSTQRLSVGAFPNMRHFSRLLETSGVIPGNQPKLSADLHGTVISTLDAQHASRLIIKAGSAGQQGISEPVLNEWYCTRLAKQIGFDTSFFEVSRLFGGSMIIRRFDRMRVNGSVDRLPVINGCQALGISQSQAFEAMTAKSLYELSTQTSQPNKVLRRLFAWVCYNTIIGNSDLALNDLSFSMSVDEQRNTKLELMPIYDLSSELCRPTLPAKASLFRGLDLKSVTFDQVVDIADDMNYNTEAAHVDLEAILHSTRDSLQGMEAILMKEITQVRTYESIRMGNAELGYLRSVGRGIEQQIDRLIG